MSPFTELDKNTRVSLMTLYGLIHYFDKLTLCLQNWLRISNNCSEHWIMPPTRIASKFRATGLKI